MLRLIQAEFLKLRRKKFIVFNAVIRSFHAIFFSSFIQKSDKQLLNHYNFISGLHSAIQLGLYFLLY